MTQEYAVEVVALVTSPGHSYWFHSHDPADGMGPHPTLRPRQVQVVAGQGIVGDRFYGRVSRLASAVSFVSAEVVDEVAEALGTGPLDPALTRRNVVLRGIDLNSLRHREFTLDTGAGPVGFAAAGETAPCRWMDAVLGDGARRLMRGRGGLRANPTTDGVLVVGPAVLRT